MNEKTNSAEWITRAEQDVEMQKRALQDPPMWESASFHAQQSAEKILKAYLVSQGWLLKKTHDLSDLLTDCLAYDPSLAPLRADCVLLTPFAVTGRYRGDRVLNQLYRAFTILKGHPYHCGH